MTNLEGSIYKATLLPRRSGGSLEKQTFSGLTLEGHNIMHFQPEIPVE